MTPITPSGYTCGTCGQPVTADTRGVTRNGWQHNGGSVHDAVPLAVIRPRWHRLTGWYRPHPAPVPAPARRRSTGFLAWIYGDLTKEAAA